MSTDHSRPAPQIARHGVGPQFWKNETGGRLKPAVVAYLEGEHINAEQIALIRAYLRQWIGADVWARGPTIDALRRQVDALTTAEAIDRWLDDALQEGIDPL